jgi:hypothetical protein
VRLVCRPKGDNAQPLAGKGLTVYPVGYLGPGGRLLVKPLSEEITIQAGNVPGNAKDMDFAFYVPTHLTPALIGFKSNNLQRIAAVTTDEEASGSTREREREPAEEPAAASSSEG